MFNKTKLLCLVMAVLMVLPMLVACTKEPAAIPVDVVADGYSDYIILYPTAGGAKSEKAAAQSLKKAIKEATGADLIVDSDWMAADETACEILVGVTNRAESKEAAELLRERDFVITHKNDRVIIVGGTEAATVEGVNYFIENYINKDEKKVTVFEHMQNVVPFDYMLGEVSINGVSIKEYTLVYPEDADLITRYIAYNLSDYFLANAGYELNITSDKAAETKYEILIGSTNRTASANAAAVSRNSDQYVLYKDGDKVVMQGDSYMVGAAAGAFVNQYVQSAGANAPVNVTNLPTAGAAQKHEFKKATSAILMIGDGMGFSHIQAAELAGLTDFIADCMPNKTSCITESYSVQSGSKQYTDSAAAATALATGYKTVNGYIGVDRNGATRQNVRELAHSLGALTAVVTTDVITGATPAGFLCHEGSRNSTAALNSQIDKLLANGDVTYAEGGFAESKLTEYTREALRAISVNGSKHFAMIEEAHIDKHSHKNSLSDARMAVKYYNDVIAYVIGFIMLHPETALIVTADHECGKLLYDESKGVFVYNSDDHTNVDVPLYAIGGGTEAFAGTGEKVDNTDVAKFIASIFGATNFGQ